VSFGLANTQIMCEVKDSIIAWKAYPSRVRRWLESGRGLFPSEREGPRDSV